jgi:hypothetical protein
MRKVHPAAELFPLMEGEEFDALVRSIKEHGQRNEILLYEDAIIDGRNRYRACEAAGVLPIFKPVVITGDPWAWAWEQNAERRHLTPEQKAAIRELVCRRSDEWRAEQDRIKAEADQARREAADGRRQAGGRLGPVRVTDGTHRQPAKKKGGGAARKAKAAAAGVSTGTMAKAEAVKDERLLEAVARGEKGLNEAVRESRPEPAPKAEAPKLYPVKVLLDFATVERVDIYAAKVGLSRAGAIVSLVGIGLEHTT